MDAPQDNNKTVEYLQFCSRHSIALITKKHLQRKPKLFGGTAKIVNTIRAGTTSRKLFTAFQRAFQNGSCVAALPQRPLRGRWGSLYNCMSYLLKAGLLTGQLGTAYDIATEVEAKKKNSVKLERKKPKSRLRRKAKPRRTERQKPRGPKPERHGLRQRLRQRRKARAKAAQKVNRSMMMMMTMTRRPMRTRTVPMSSSQRRSWW